MPKFTIEISRTISTDVEVEAETPDAAIEKVSSHAFPLPPREEWEGHKNWAYLVFDEQGQEVAEMS